MNFSLILRHIVGTVYYGRSLYVQGMLNYPMNILKNFVVFEGGDGAGTTTQIEKLRKSFSELKIQARFSSPPLLFDTLEPTNGPIGRLIRSSLKGDISLTSEAIALLFAADRHDHLYAPGGIQEHCNNGELVVSDRYVMSSLVYQGITCGEAFPLSLNEDFPWPELTLFFDLDPEIAQKRMKNRPEKDIYEALEFQIQVYRRYKLILNQYKSLGCRFEVINASLPAEEVGREVWRALQKMPIFKG